MLRVGHEPLTRAGRVSICSDNKTAIRRKVISR